MTKIQNYDKKDICILMYCRVYFENTFGASSAGREIEFPVDHRERYGVEYPR